MQNELFVNVWRTSMWKTTFKTADVLGLTKTIGELRLLVKELFSILDELGCHSLFEARSAVIAKRRLAEMMRIDNVEYVASKNLGVRRHKKHDSIEWLTSQGLVFA